MRTLTIFSTHEERSGNMQFQDVRIGQMFQIPSVSPKKPFLCMRLAEFLYGCLEWDGQRIPSDTLVIQRLVYILGTLAEEGEVMTVDIEMSDTQKEAFFASLEDVFRFYNEFMEYREAREA